MKFIRKGFFKITTLSNIYRKCEFLDFNPKVTGSIEPPPMNLIFKEEWSS